MGEQGGEPSGYLVPVDTMEVLTPFMGHYPRVTHRIQHITSYTYLAIIMHRN